MQSVLNHSNGPGGRRALARPSCSSCERVRAAAARWSGQQWRIYRHARRAFDIPGVHSCEYTLSHRFGTRFAARHCLRNELEQLLLQGDERLRVWLRGSAQCPYRHRQRFITLTCTYRSSMLRRAERGQQAAHAVAARRWAAMPIALRRQQQRSTKPVTSAALSRPGTVGRKGLAAPYTLMLVTALLLERASDPPNSGVHAPGLVPVVTDCSHTSDCTMLCSIARSIHHSLVCLRASTGAQPHGAALVPQGAAGCPPGWGGAAATKTPNRKTARRHRQPTAATPLPAPRLAPARARGAQAATG